MFKGKIKKDNVNLFYCVSVNFSIKFIKIKFLVCLFVFYLFISICMSQGLLKQFTII